MYLCIYLYIYVCVCACVYIYIYIYASYTLYILYMLYRGMYVKWHQLFSMSEFSHESSVRDAMIFLGLVDVITIIIIIISLSYVFAYTSLF